MQGKPDIISNVFNKGMSQNPELQESEGKGYRYALNAGFSDQDTNGYSLTNEESNSLYASFGGDIRGVGLVEEKNRFVVFHGSNSISWVPTDHEGEGTPEKIMDMPCGVTFDPCEKIMPVFKALGPCRDTIIYFSVKNEYYRVDIEEELRGASGGKTCEDYKLLKCACIPVVAAVPESVGGGGLQNGSYIFHVQAEDEDGNQTNFFTNNRKVDVGGGDNEPGDVSPFVIDLKVSGLDATYNKVNIAVTKIVKGSRTTYLLPSISYNSTSVSYKLRGGFESNNASLIAESELVPQRKHYYGKRVFQSDGTLFLYQTSPSINLDFQREVNNATASLVVYQVPIEEAWRYTTLTRREGYIYGVVYYHCDGTPTQVFPIVNYGGGGGGVSNSASIGSVSYTPAKYESKSDDELKPEEQVEDALRRYVRQKLDAINSELRDCCQCADCGQGNCSDDMEDIEDINKSLLDSLRELIYEERPSDSATTTSVESKFNAAYPNQTRLRLVRDVIDKFPEQASVIASSFARSGNIFDPLQNTLVDLSGSSFRLQDYVDMGKKVVMVGFVTSSQNSYDYLEDNISEIKASLCTGAELIFMEMSNTASNDNISGIGEGTVGDFKSLIGNERIVNLQTGFDWLFKYNIFLANSSFVTDEYKTRVSILYTTKGISSLGEEPTGALIKERCEVAKDVEYPTGGDGYSNSSRSCQLGGKCDAEGTSCQAGGSCNRGSCNSGAVGGSGDLLGSCKSLVDRVDEYIEKDDRKKRVAAEYTVSGTGDVSTSRRSTVNSQHEVFGDGNLGRKGSAGFEQVTSEELYPTYEGCDGTPVFGGLAGQPIRIGVVPGADQIPLIESGQAGVPNKFDPGNFEHGSTYANIIGLRVEGIPIPSDDIMRSPLCKNKPFEIVQIPVDSLNSRVVAKGMAIHTMTGQVGGKTMAIPKHAVNSVEYVDENIRNGDSRFGSNNGAAAYVLHSPDLMGGTGSINADSVDVETEIYGRGHRHGLYATGTTPNDFYKNQIDQRGARCAVSLTREAGIGNYGVPLSGIVRAAANSNVAKAPGMSLDLCNRWRESSVYFELGGGKLSLSNGGSCDSDSDLSFQGDGMVHERPIPSAAAWNVTLKRDQPRQYGNLIYARFVSTGLVGTSVNQTSVEGVSGESFINLFSIKRTSYVSSKQGEIPLDRPADKYKPIHRFLGINDTTRLPLSNDKEDIRNCASLHGCAEDPPNCTGNLDFYFPRTVSTLVTFPVESRVNTALRQLGDPELGQYWYPYLKGYNVDSSMPPDTAPERCYLNKFHSPVKRPSRFQLAVKTTIRIILNIVLPASWLMQIPNIESWGVALTGYLAATPIVAGIWLLLSQYLFDNERLDHYLEIEDLRFLTDTEGGDTKHSVTGFEDNYMQYNGDYSDFNGGQNFYSAPEYLDYCKCNEWAPGVWKYGCVEDHEISNEVVYSNKQMPGSNIDAYRNFDAFSTVRLPMNEGLVMNMFELNGRIYAHLTDGIVPVMATRQDSVQAASSVFGLKRYYAGESISKGLPQGYAGTEDPKAAKVTPWGYSFVDRNARGWYLFDGSSFEVLSSEKYGMESFFKEYMNFCAVESSPCFGCVDEGASGGVYYDIGVDPRKNRLLLTKKDTQNGSWTISFSKNRGVFISFHSYIPNMYVSDRNHLYSIKGGGIHKHGDSRDSYQTFYGQYAPFIVEYVSAYPYPFKFKSMSVHADAQRFHASFNAFARDKTIFFNKAWFYNSDQSTGILSTVIDRDGMTGYSSEQQGQLPHGLLPVTNYGRLWKFNRVRDRKVDKETPVISRSTSCDPFYDPTAVVDCPPEEWNTSFDDYFMVTRLVFDDIINSDVNLKLFKSVILKESKHYL